MNLNVANLSICRVCLCETGTLKSIFTMENFTEHTLRINEVMTICASVQVEIGDGLPQEICTECLIRLSDAYAFKILCEQTDFHLRNNLVLIIKSEDENVHEDLEHDNSAEGSRSNMHEDLEQNKVVEASALENIVSLEDADIKMRVKADNFDSLIHEVEHNADASLVKYEAKEFNENESRKVSDFTENIKEVDYDIKISDILIPKIVYGASSSCSYKNDSNTIKTGRTKSYECDICHEGFKIKHELQIHNRTHSDIKTSRTTSYECDICHEGFKIKRELQIHKRTHSDITNQTKPYQCDICHESFKFKRQLEPHKRTHSDEKPKCDECGTEFAAKYGLDRHKRRIHGPVKMRECPVCHKYFRDTATMEQHLSTHTVADQQHQCDQCGKSFYNRAKLMQHLKVHSDQACCFICRKWFPDKATLKLHRGTHTVEDKKHQCDQCGKCFYTSYKLKRHKIIHTGEKNFVCFLCNKSFGYSSALRGHIKTHATK